MPDAVSIRPFSKAVTVSLARGPVIRQKALLLALLMHRTWQLYLRVFVNMDERAALIASTSSN